MFVVRIRVVRIRDVLIVMSVVLLGFGSIESFDAKFALLQREHAGRKFPFGSSDAAATGSSSQDLQKFGGPLGGWEESTWARRLLGVESTGLLEGEWAQCQESSS
jgi:hypothetical protein